MHLLNSIDKELYNIFIDNLKKQVQTHIIYKKGRLQTSEGKDIFCPELKPPEGFEGW